MLLQIFYIAQLSFIIFFGYLGLKYKKMCHFKIYFDREVIALFCSSNCHLKENNSYSHNV